MNEFALNGAVLNGAGSLARIVYLPSSSMSFTFALNERIAVSMVGNATFTIEPTGDIYRRVTLEGHASFSVDPVGDVYKRVSMEGHSSFSIEPAGVISTVVNLGTAPTDILFGITGDLTRNQRVDIGIGAFGFGFDMTGTAATVTLGPSGSAGFSVDAVGEMVRRAQMFGALDTVISPTARIHSVRDIGVHSTGWNTVSTGDLVRIRMLVGNAVTAFSPAGSLSIGQRIQLPTANTGFDISNTGVLRLTGGLFGTTGFSVVPTGDLSIGLRTQIPAGAVDVSFVTQGQRLRLTGGLHAATNFTSINVVGDLHKGYRTQLPPGSVSMQFSTVGALRANYRMQGAVDMGIVNVGKIDKRVVISGNTALGFDINGALANNAQGADLLAVLMIRPETQREMTR